MIENRQSPRGSGENDTRNRLIDQNQQGINFQQQQDPNDSSFQMKRLKLMNQKNEESQSQRRQRSPLNVETNIQNKVSLENNSGNYYDNKWEEFKILGSNIKNRSYASTIIYNDALYIYGGYQIDEGILDDFWLMNLQTQEFRWNKVKQLKVENSPGKRTRHIAVLIDQFMLIYGGQSPLCERGNHVYCFNLKNNEWSVQLQQQEDILNPIDSHNSAIDNEKNMIIAFGYHQKTGLFTNAVKRYNLNKNQWTTLFEDIQVKSQTVPRGRASSAMAFVKNKLYSFGGHDGLQRLSDLWEFDLNKNSWREIIASSGIIPKIRSGHSLICDNTNFLILFGGIHDITWELNDMYLFDIDQKTWIEVDSDSARNKADLGYSPLGKKGSQGLKEDLRIQQKDQLNDFQNTLRSSNTNNLSPSNNNQNSSNKKGNLNYGGVANQNQTPQQQQNQFVSGSVNKQGSLSPRSHAKKNGNNTMDSFDEELKSPIKSLHEKKIKQFQMQKSEMLKMFEINDKNKQSVEDIIKDRSPTSQAMNNSIQIIGNPSPNIKIKTGKLTEFGKQRICKFNEPLQDHTPTRLGKRPCARDGHQACFYNNKMIIFGGDRHNMSFNTVQILDISKAINQND